MNIKDRVTIIRHLQFEVVKFEGSGDVSQDRIIDAIRLGNFHNYAVDDAFWISFGTPKCPTCLQKCAPEDRVLLKRVA